MGWYRRATALCPPPEHILGAVKILICVGVRLYLGFSFKVQQQKNPHQHQEYGSWFGTRLEIVRDKWYCDSSCVFIRCTHVLDYETWSCWSQQRRYFVICLVLLWTAFIQALRATKQIVKPGECWFGGLGGNLCCKTWLAINTVYYCRVVSCLEMTSSSFC